MNYNIQPNNEYYNEESSYRVELEPKTEYDSGSILREPDHLVFYGRGYMAYQPLYNFVTEEYTYDIPRDDLDASALLPQWDMIQLIYTDLRWNGGAILNSLYTALGDCINQNYEVQMCVYQQNVIMQIYGDYPNLDMGQVPYGSENNQNFSDDPDIYNQNDGYGNAGNGYGFNPLNFIG